MSLKTNTRVPPFSAEHTEALCRILADTSDGLTGSEIGQILTQMKLEDPASDITKWKRLFSAFAVFQNKHQVGNAVIVFVTRAMSPARYTERPAVFESRRLALNRVLAFSGLTLLETGQVAKCSQAQNLDESLRRASHFKSRLESRNVHAEVFRYCTPEILAKNYFHAVFEAMKSISGKVRSISGLTGDGAQLVERAFSFGRSGQPVLAINALDTETRRGEQRGFVNLLVGLYGTVRNPLAHDPKIDWDMTEQDALDIMSAISLVHRKLDECKKL